MAFVPALITFHLKRTSSLSRSTFLSPRWQPQFNPIPQSIQSSHVVSPQCSDMGLSFPDKKYDEQFRIGVISTRWNEKLVQPMVDTVKTTLVSKGIPLDDIVQMQVPGSWELPIAARLMCAAQKVDAVICLGVLIKGETEHYEYIAGPVSSALMDLQLTLSTPITFGVLCCTTREQAEKRSIGDGSHAEEWALTALEMAQLRKSQIGGVSAALRYPFMVQNTALLKPQGVVAINRLPKSTEVLRMFRAQCQSTLEGIPKTLSEEGILKNQNLYLAVYQVTVVQNQLKLYE